MTAERDPITLSESTVLALGGEERSDEAPRAGRPRPLHKASIRLRESRRHAHSRNEGLIMLPCFRSVSFLGCRPDLW